MQTVPSETYAPLQLRMQAVYYNVVIYFPLDLKICMITHIPHVNGPQDSSHSGLGIRDYHHMDPYFPLGLKICMITHIHHVNSSLYSSHCKLLDVSIVQIRSRTQRLAS
jgi:hypothetical protein